MSRALTVFVLVVSGLMAAGCGGTTTGSGSTQRASTAPQLSRAALRDKLIGEGDTVCEVHFVGKPFVPPKAEPEPRMRGTARASAAGEEVALGLLSKITPPAFMAASWQRLLADRRTLIADWLRLAKEGLSANPHILTSIYHTRESMLAVARGEGFKECQEFG